MSYQVDRDRWDKMTILDQMGNIGSEVGRTLKAASVGDFEARDQALTRALDLFDATQEALLRRKSPRLKEVLRAKDQFLQAVFSSTPSKNEIDNINRYFMQFAVASRLHK